jgi:RpiB/LacA/LacB family sugar-phosphate isomerase
MRIALGADHAGYPYQAAVTRALEADGHRVLDLGTTSTEPVDYPDYARAVGTAVRDGAADLGVLICGSGAGVSIAANKLRGVRAALCHDLFTARQAREDDDANVLCLGARVVDVELAVQLVREFVAARFSRADRHLRRLAKVIALERSELAGATAGGAGGPRQDAAEHPAVAAAVARLERLDAVTRIWREDATLWAEAEAARRAVHDRLGWLTAPTAMRAAVSDLTSFAESVRGEGIADVVLLGMGGSSLAAEVLASTFGSRPGWPALAVLDTTDAGAVRDTRARLKLARTVFLVSSKSGTTAEMLALYRYFHAEVARDVPHPGRHFVAITDPGTPLERMAGDAGFRRAFLNDPRVGGRFSALTYFGLVPGALIGLDVGGLLERAERMATRGRTAVPRENPAVALGASIGALAQAGRDKLTLALSEPLRSFGGWLEQLLTESTGKQGKGIVVIDGETLGAPEAYADDRVFVAITLGRDTALDARLTALEAAGFPVLTMRLDDPLDLGGEFFRWELATAVAGIVLGVNPFDEPNVAQAKEATNAALARFRETGQLPEWPVDSVDSVASTLAQARPGDYVAILAYTTPPRETGAALARLRALVRDRTRLATTVGYGPRYLHSTGQLHKGGPPTPILLLLLGGDSEDVRIPGEAYGFSTLKAAQALGDVATLRAANRRALWLPLSGPVADEIDRLTATLAGRLQ